MINPYVIIHTLCNNHTMKQNIQLKENTFVIVYATHITNNM